MLNNEGIFVEGAGAIGIAALINDPEGKKYNGDVLVIVSGGNIATASLINALATHTNDNKINKLLGFSSVKLPQEVIKYGKEIKEGKNTTNKNEEKENIIENEKAWDGIIDNLYMDTKNLKNELQEHVEYSKGENLDINNNSI